MRVVTVVVVAGMLPAFWSGARAADRASIRRAVDAGSRYLSSVDGEIGGGVDALRTYALLKAGGKAGDPVIGRHLADIVERCEGEDYRSYGGQPAVYSAGIEAMILSDVDPEKYRPQLQKIAAFLLTSQLENGAFDYRGPDAIGDTSVTQYGALGLWAIARSGIPVPPETWDKLAVWHLRGQQNDGGFMYIPMKTEGLTGGDTNASMTAAASATMTICSLFLHPVKTQEVTGLSDGLYNNPRRIAKPSGDAESGDPNDPLGVLTVRKGAATNGVKVPEIYEPTATFNALQNSIGRCKGFVDSRFRIDYHFGGWRMYYFYTIERMGALVGVESLQGRDWYDAIADELLATQQGDGSWDMPRFEVGENRCVSTSFAVLFLTRSTAKLLNRTPPADPIGGGLQVGGRGLPDDLASVTMRNGRVAKDESLGPLDDLLKSLESGAGDDLFNLQTQIVKKIQLGDRSQLVGQVDRLVKLLEYPDPNIRRTALWALARSDDLTIARHMVAALEDPDRDVLIEAHNALCWMSRRPNAFDIPPDPLAGLPDDATDEQKQQAVDKWRANALKHWGNWYLKMCSYEERNTPFAHDLARKIGLR